jgi:hypothetical protein
LFVAVDRTRKVALAEWHPRAKPVMAAAFLRRVLENCLTCAYRAHRPWRRVHATRPSIPAPRAPLRPCLPRIGRATPPKQARSPRNQ